MIPIFAWPACIATLITSMEMLLPVYFTWRRSCGLYMELETMRYQKSYYQEVEISQQTGAQDAS